MGGVFANGLEISGKGSDGKTIATFPDVCFTPPENPATPPGVPVPYPSFGMSSDTDKGTGTVKISGKTVNIKNKSYLTKTTGTEAGAAAKKGIITSKNTGKEYFNSWSNDVKFDSEPVIRFTDLATNNHSSPNSNTAPWAHILTKKKGGITCEQILIDLDLKLHKHWDSPCSNPDESEHMAQNAFFQNARGGPDGSIPDLRNYSANTAPCICMEGPSTEANTPHGQKTAAQRAFAKNMTPATTIGDGVTNEINNVRTFHPKLQNQGQKGEHALECLEEIIYAYLESASEQADGTKRSGDALKNTPIRKPRGPKINAPTVSPPIVP